MSLPQIAAPYIWLNTLPRYQNIIFSHFGYKTKGRLVIICLWVMPRFFYYRNMAKTRQQKEVALTELISEMKTAKSVVFANYQGLTVTEMEELRSLCREQAVRCMALKKTLVTKALKESGIEDIDAKAFQGGVAVFLGQEDEVTPAKLVAEFAKTHELATIFGGILEEKFILAQKVNDLAKLPSKMQLHAQLVGTLNAPISGFANVLAGNLRGLVHVINAIKEAKA